MGQGMAARALNNNEFQMWRALFAFAFADGTLSQDEKNVLSDHLKDVELTEAQQRTLVSDMQKHEPVEGLHEKITDDVYKQLFCDVARTLAWCDGEIDRQEEEILKRVACLKKAENQVFLKRSAQSSIFERYLKQYRENGKIGAKQPLPLFEAWA